MLVILESTQSFQLLVLVGLAGTQVIAAFDPRGIGEYSVISAFGTRGLASTQSFQLLVLGTREYSSHFSFSYSLTLASTQSF